MDLTRDSYQAGYEASKAVYTNVPEIVPGTPVYMLRQDPLSGAAISASCIKTGGRRRSRRSHKGRKASKKSHRRRASKKRSRK